MKKPFQTKKALFILAALFLLTYFSDSFYLLNDLQGNKFLIYTYRIFDKDLHVLDYSQLSKIIQIESTHSRVVKDGSHYQIAISGFPRFLMRNLSEEIRRKGLHPTYRLRLYSMYYGIDALQEYNRTGDRELFNQLKTITTAVLDDIESFRFFPERFHFYDHSVSERVEFLILMKAQLQQTAGNENLTKQIDRHILHCADLLMDDRYFSWEGNHGTMQVRALLHITAAMPDSKLGNKCLDLALKRISEILPMFIADDGAILESASGYWLYIFQQWDYISKMKVLPPDLRSQILKRVNNAKEFIETIITSDGFLQGFGDSFSQVIDEDVFMPSKGNQVFSFSDGIAGLKWKVGSTNHQLLFVSLDTPPGIHKLPEDLAVYLYVGQPFFINTGTYAYDQSPERKYVNSEISQSTVSFLEPAKLTYSRITDLRIDEDSTSITLEGRKWYGNDSIKRTIVFYATRGNIEITDASSKQLSSRFNVHPDVTIQTITNNSITLTGKNETLTIEYQAQLKKNRSWVSMKVLDKTPIEQLEFIGNPIKLRIKLSNIVPDFGLTARFSNYYTQRSIIAERLSQRYSGKLMGGPPGAMTNSLMTIFLASRVFIFVVFVASLFFARKEGFPFSSILLLSTMSVTLIVDLLTSGSLFLSAALFLRSILTQYMF